MSQLMRETGTSNLESEIAIPSIGNERRVAEDRRDYYWLYYVVTSCKSQPCLQEPINNPARFPWHEVKKVDHYYISVDALTQPTQVRAPEEAYGNPSR